jgi:cytoskeletal protein CcmA (bactofilin family)
MFEKSKGSSPRGTDTRDFEPALDRTPISTPPEPTTRMTAMIGPTIRIKGEVTGEENLIIEGKVDGSVTLSGKDLTVGQSGQVKADVVASVVKIDGEVRGDISGAEKVIVSKTGKVEGNIVAPRVTLEDGAKFKGAIDMDPNGRSVSDSQPASIKPAAAPKTVEKGPTPATSAAK